MPVYVYRCQCKYEFEATLPYFAPNPECQKCGGKEVEKVLTPAIIARVNEIRTVGQQGESNYKRDRNKIQEISQMKKEHEKENKRINKG